MVGVIDTQDTRRRKMNTTRKEYLEILDALGAQYTEKISSDRAKKKIKRYLEKKGVPGDFTERQTEIINEEGLMPEGHAPMPNPPKEKKKAETRSYGVKQAFTKLVEGRETITRQEIINAMKNDFGEKGKWTGLNYISLAKKSPKFFGFQMEESQGVLSIK
jgi:hypothetical protein